MTKPLIICLTPVKNELWILERFIKCASLWADHIIIADQGSDDGSREIATKFSKVTLVNNPSSTFNEPERQKILINAARKIDEPRLLIALDADEFLTSNFLKSTEWNKLLNVPPGTVIRFQWPIILEDMKTYWLFPNELVFGFMDDGSNHIGKKIHSPRLPIPDKAPYVSINQIKVMHYAFVNYKRWQSRQRWYQCWELLNKTKRRPVELYRFYHKDVNIPEHKINAMPENWLKGYVDNGIDMTRILDEKLYRWDKEVLELLYKYGTKKFSKIAMWDINWTKLYREIYNEDANIDFSDPRNYFEKIVHRWLLNTQRYYVHYGPQKSRFINFYFRCIRKMLRIWGW